MPTTGRRGQPNEPCFCGAPKSSSRLTLSRFEVSERRLDWTESRRFSETDSCAGAPGLSIVGSGVGESATVAGVASALGEFFVSWSEARRWLVDDGRCVRERVEAVSGTPSKYSCMCVHVVRITHKNSSPMISAGLSSCPFSPLSDGGPLYFRPAYVNPPRRAADADGQGWRS